MTTPNPETLVHDHGKNEEHGTGFQKELRVSGPVEQQNRPGPHPSTSSFLPLGGVPQGYTPGTISLKEHNRSRHQLGGARARCLIAELF